MACELTTIQAEACTSGIGKVTDRLALLQLIAQLQCEVSELSPGGACANLEGASSPLNVVTPDFIGQVYVQTGGVVWQAGSLLSSSWVTICTPGDLSWGPTPEGPVVNLDLTGFSVMFANGEFSTVTFYNPTSITNNLTASVGLDLSNITFANLASVGLDVNFQTSGSIISLTCATLTSVGGSLNVSVCANLDTLSFPVLNSIGVDLMFNDCPLLATLNIDSLVTISGNLAAENCVSLVVFSAPVWLPTDGTSINFNGDALDAASVNHILARCVAAAVTTCTIDLSGGTNAAPTGQGITDKADLITAGNTVTTN